MMSTTKQPRQPHCPPHLSAEQRLVRNIKVDPLTGCHLWQRSLSSRGYARIVVRGKHHLAHRLAWTLRHGPIPEGMEVCHRCDIRHCINPDHHFLGNRSGNMLDLARKRRARVERSFADERGQGGVPAGTRPNELMPIRLYVAGIEIVGEAVIRSFDPRGRVKDPFRRANDPPDPPAPDADSPARSR